ncbi:MAG: DUF4437 domain-containing protein [Gemmatimonadetes bacterium]|nr:DUF4437 domain-containing protein [Gemmatimonadota bacterium]
MEIVPVSAVDWEPLNPARGDASPQAGTLWGDRNGTVATGFLVKFVDGFSSPPHIHNVSYRGIVISGQIHNDDPNAAAMWMPAGSYWTQPKGEVHITAARGTNNVAYIEIEEGPYLVKPVEEAFDSGERPVNVDPSNLVWLPASHDPGSDRPGAGAPDNGPEVAYLWGDPVDDRLSGRLVKLPAGFTGSLHGRGASLRAVVIEGTLMHGGPGDTGGRPNEAAGETLDPGSSFSSKSESVHRVSCAPDEECVLYLRAEGAVEIAAAPPAHGAGG